MGFSVILSIFRVFNTSITNVACEKILGPFHHTNNFPKIFVSMTSETPTKSLCSRMFIIFQILRDISPSGQPLMISETPPSSPLMNVECKEVSSIQVSVTYTDGSTEIRGFRSKPLTHSYVSSSGKIEFYT